jgi:hypothetical protein
MAHGGAERRKTLAIAAMIEHRSEVDAAAAAGVSRRTLTRWLGDPNFRARLEQASQEVLDRAMAMIGAGTARALQTLLELMEDLTTPAGVRQRAAASWLGHFRLVRLGANGGIDRCIVEVPAESPDIAT